MRAPRQGKVKQLENGRPHLRFHYRGNGVYDVHAVTSGGDAPIGQIRTHAPLAKAQDPGNWTAQHERFDSMQAAGESLLDHQQENAA